MKTVTFEGKGGGGKTTTCANLAVAAHQAGHRVGLIDADPQASLCDWRHLRGTADIPVVACGAGEMQDVLVRAERARLDFVLVDMPPGFGADTLAIVGVADFVLLPMRPTAIDLCVTRRWIEILRSAAARFGVAINGAPPCRQGEDSPSVRDARAALRQIGAPLWPGQITHRLVIPYAAIGGRGAAECDAHGPAAHEYRALWRGIERVLNPDRRITNAVASKNVA
jgi:chromosome partitioning protein